MNSTELQKTLERHKLWLDGDKKGERANLRDANLCGADLCGADLRGANLDFSSGIPFHCGGTQIKGDERLFSQVVYHLTRQDWQGLDLESQVWFNSIPARIRDAFKQYRNDV